MVNITQGENKIFTILIRDQDGNPFDLTGFTKFKVCMPLVSGSLTVTEIAGVNGSIVAILGNPILGKLQVTINFADTATLNVGNGQDIGLVLDNAAGTDPRPKNSPGVLNVFAAVCV